MPHPTKLLNECKKHLEKDYPSSEYDYLFERIISGGFYPDIQIKKDGKLVCVCELGYTSAEKIKDYREMGISDIRWYSKGLDLVVQTGEYDRDLNELKKESIQRIKRFEQDCKAKIKSNAEAEISTFELAERSKLEDLIKVSIARKLRKRQEKINELINREYYLLMFHWVCWFCDEDKNNRSLTEEQLENLGGAETIYFSEEKYQCFYECEIDDDHETSEGPFTWDDESGPHPGKFEEFLEEYIRLHLRISNK